MDLTIAPLDLSARVDEALAVQAVAFGLGPDEVAVRRQIVQRHMQFPRPRPRRDRRGAPRRLRLRHADSRTHWWSTVVEPYLRAAGNDFWLDDSFVITELHVLPGHQNRGIGRRLITTITDSATEPRSILSAIDTDSPARGLYHSLATSTSPARCTSRARRARTP